MNALADGETDGNDWVCFLVPVRDAEDEEFDDDDDDEDEDEDDDV